MLLRTVSIVAFLYDSRLDIIWYRTNVDSKGGAAVGTPLGEESTPPSDTAPFLMTDHYTGRVGTKFDSAQGELSNTVGRNMTADKIMLCSHRAVAGRPTLIP